MPMVKVNSHATYAAREHSIMPSGDIATPVGGSQAM